jgi:hypothetical protein
VRAGGSRATRLGISATRLAAAIAVACTLTAGPWTPSVAQELSTAAGRPPAEIAEEFHRGFQSMAWDGVARRMHPDALAEVRAAVDIVVEADSTGWALRHLAGGVTDRAAYRALADIEVFRRAMAGVQAEVPGLLSSLVSRRSQILGSVAEGSDTVHVVYRIVGLVHGSQPRVRALTTVRTPDGWRVRYAEEADVLHTALRGVPIPGR